MTPLANALLATLFVGAASYAISLATRLLNQAPIDLLVLVNSGLIPLVVALPLLLHIVRQGENLEQAHAALQDAHRILAERASRDSLTGLLNRDSFVAPLELTRRLSDRGTLLIADADHFKA